MEETLTANRCSTGEPTIYVVFRPINGIVYLRVTWHSSLSSLRTTPLECRDPLVPEKTGRHRKKCCPQ